MKKRGGNTKIGDIFCAKIDESHKKYLQYIVSDLTQLNSDVIRVFKNVYPIDANPDLSEIVNDEVDFYAHCVTKEGIKRSLWDKVGNTQEIGCIENIIFKDKNDYTRTDIQNDWWFWRINGNHIDVNELIGEYKNAYLGLVFQPERIMHKLKTGSYPGVYAQFE